MWLELVIRMLGSLLDSVVEIDQLTVRREVVEFSSARILEDPQPLSKVIPFGVDGLCHHKGSIGESSCN